MLGRIVVAFLFLPRYFRGEMLTAYQLIDRRFGPTLHKLTASLFLLTRAAAEGVRVFAISIVVGLAIGTGDILSIAIISALTLLYTFEGGLAAVIWTDVVQMALYVAGTLVAIWSLGHQIPGGWHTIHAVAAPLGKFHWLNFTLNLTTAYTFWAGLLGGTFLTMASHGTDQLMVQRLLAARNLRESRLALLSSGAVIFLQFTLFLLIGVGLFVFYGLHPHPFTSPDRIFPTFIVQGMPHGIAGLLVAAILAAAMSNLSAALNSLASTTVIDFYLPLRFSRQHTKMGAPFIAPLSHAMSGSTSNPNTTLISRLATVFWALVLFLIAVYAIQRGGRGHVVETGLSIASVAYGSLLGVFLLGTLTRYANQFGAILGMITGLTLNLYLWRWTHVAFTWYVLIGALATFAVGTLVSLLLPKPLRALAVLLLATLIGCPMITRAQASVIVGSLPPPPPSAPYDFTSASRLITQAIAAHKLPGAVLLVGHSGKIVFEQAYGNRKLPNEPGIDGKPSPAEPMTTDTIFDMASLTKVLVTTTAILQLYEAGKLDLDTPLAHYLPAFAAPDPAATAPASASASAAASASASVSRYPKASALGLSPAPKDLGLQPLGYALQPAATNPTLPYKSQITIRQLLTHYSGLPEDVSLKDDWGLASPNKPEGLRRALAAIPYGPPAQTFKYSDINFILLGALVEKLSGEPLDDYAFMHIFRSPPNERYQIRHDRYLLHLW